jgi:hypothetical protein
MALSTDIRVATRIDGDDFDAARKDSKVSDLVRDARKYGDDLRKNGKDHSLVPSSHR